MAWGPSLSGSLLGAWWSSQRMTCFANCETLNKDERYCIICFHLIPIVKSKTLWKYEFSGNQVLLQGEKLKRTSLGTSQNQLRLKDTKLSLPLFFTISTLSFFFKRKNATISILKQLVITIDYPYDYHFPTKLIPSKTITAITFPQITSAKTPLKCPFHPSCTPMIF